MDRRATHDVRARVCAGLRGDVVEIGFGTGLNTPYYPPEVTKVLYSQSDRRSGRGATRAEAGRLVPFRRAWARPRSAGFAVEQLGDRTFVGLHADRRTPHPPGAEPFAPDRTVDRISSLLLG